MTRTHCKNLCDRATARLGWLGSACLCLAWFSTWLVTAADGDGQAGGAPSPAAIALEKAETWAPFATAAPLTRREADGGVRIEANGTPTCAGGWQFCFRGIHGGQVYRIRTRVERHDVPLSRDCLLARVLWGKWDPNRVESGTTPWNSLLPTARPNGVIEFQCVARAPEGASCLTVRYIFRWSERGTSRWSAPVVEPATLPERKPVKICVVNATRQTPERIAIRGVADNLGLPKDVAESVNLWASLIEAACVHKPQLVVTPELVIGGKDFRAGAIEVPGPATRPFEVIARQHRVYLVLGLKERRGAAVHNSAVLVGPEGVQGVYRKVHLATGEDVSGIQPGNSFPVFPTPLGRVGCLICMDTTLCESARMLALGGADIICMSIMGDLRADRFSPGGPIHNDDRWKAIMRTRALDNQVCMAVARNAGQGSCIIDRKGEILAWNDGDQEFTLATLPADDGYRYWDGGDFRETTFLLRRPHLYGAYTDPANLGPLGVPTAAHGRPGTGGKQ